MLDYVTALVILIAASLTVALGLILVWRREREGTAYPWWAAGFCLNGLGVALVLVDDPALDLLSLDIDGLLMLLAYSCWICGCRRFNGDPLRPTALLPAFVWLLGIAIPAVQESFHLRLAFLNIGAASGYLLLCLAIWPTATRTAANRRPLALFLACAGIWSLGIAALALWLQPVALSAYSLAWLDGVLQPLELLVMVLFGGRLMRERTEARLQALAANDPLTGVLNRRGLFDRLERMAGQADPRAGRIAVLLFDLDHFKRVNDRYGHHAGDIVLAAFCRLAEAQLRPADLIGRLGGEEFAAILQVPDLARAEEIAERIRAAVAGAPIDADGSAIPVTVSVGIAMLPPGGQGGSAPFAAADAALYEAKAAGRNRVAVASDPA